MDRTSWNRFTIAVENVLFRTTWAAFSTVFPSTFVAVVLTNVPVIAVQQHCTSGARKPNLSARVCKKTTCCRFAGSCCIEDQCIKLFIHKNKSSDCNEKKGHKVENWIRTKTF